MYYALTWQLVFKQWRSIKIGKLELLSPICDA